MRTLRTAYFIVVERSWGETEYRSKELIGPRAGIGFKTKKGAQKSLEGFTKITGYVQLFHFRPVERKKDNDHSGYFSSDRHKT